MQLKLTNQTFNLVENILVYHLCNAQANTIELQKIKNICETALADPSAIKHCFELDIDNSSTVLFQFFHKKMNLIILETGTLSAMLGYSLLDDIVFCPRRVYVDKALRGRTIFSKYVMPSLENLFIELGMKYITMSFNQTKTGKAHFKLYTEKANLKKLMTAGGYFTDFKPLTTLPINMFGNQQFVVYKKLLVDSPDLTTDKFLSQLK